MILHGSVPKLGGGCAEGMQELTTEAAFLVIVPARGLGDLVLDLWTEDEVIISRDHSSDRSILSSASSRGTAAPGLSR